MTWHFGTKKSRLKKKIEELENQVSKIETYSSQIGYKSLIHDSFRLFSYIGGVILFAHGIHSFLSYLIASVIASKILSLFISGIYMGTGMILIDYFLLLSKVNKSNDSIASMKEKIKRLSSKSNDN